MRLYPVPFTTQGEEKMIFNMSARQVLIIGIGLILGFSTAAILAKALKTFTLFCLPVALPFLAVAAFLAFTRIKRFGRELSMGDYIYLKFCYKHEPKHYLRFRERSS